MTGHRKISHGGKFSMSANQDSKQDAGLVDSSGYARPRTRGELWDLLLDGVPCEVVTENVEVTNMLLDGWLATMPYKVRPSENVGWSVFERA